MNAQSQYRKIEDLLIEGYEPEAVAKKLGVPVGLVECIFEDIMEMARMEGM